MKKGIRIIPLIKCGFIMQKENKRQLTHMTK